MRVALALVIVLGTHRPAAACYPVFDRVIVGAPVFEPADAVTIASEDVDVQCDERYACTVVSTFGVKVARPARATVKGFHAAELTLAVDGRAPATATPVPDKDDENEVAIDLATADTRLVITARVALVEYINGCFTDGVIARHPYLASKPASNQRVLEIETTATPRIKQPGSWDLEVDRRDATKYGPATTRLWFTTPGVFTHGGPVVLIGGVSGEGNTFRARVGWEAAIGKPWLVFGLAGETDFAAAWNVALTAEPTSSAWVLPLSFGLGGGVVLANEMKVGGRGMLSIALGGFRVVVSVDADGDGVARAAGLFGGSL